ncbi:MAG: UDP-glucose--hexose-1-phosphate uridylyltransferase [Ruminococcaceae bacterium]|nr:UDP-glucose--hexose-1-phosphate uridylyltransferase [Oscillospiraceae bacterium]
MSQNISLRVKQLIDYALDKRLIEAEDVNYSINSIIGILGVQEYVAPDAAPAAPLEEILGALCDYAYENGLIENNSVVYRDLFDTKLMGAITPRPSQVIKTFASLYCISPEEATDYFYALCRASDYIRSYRVSKDLKWKYEGKYGELDITVNLSKPEKDPKAIAAAKLLPQSGYPKCLLCTTNEGYHGNAAKPARETLRLIPVKLSGKQWYWQYSPYVYYNEHCIVLSAEHTPMSIRRETFSRLLDFVEQYPHYFVGSNADLPIVGGSILSHDHMQGGHYTFAMAKAPITEKLGFVGYDDIEAGIVEWPMSVIRLRGTDKQRLVELADKIHLAWRAYTDEAAFVFAKTDGEPHNTVTPIARMNGGMFELDIVLRNNITTEEHPLGVYHPHADVHHIKKENIGLIEVMGLAVLPARLRDEIALMREYILSGKDFAENEDIVKHKEWFDGIKDKYTFTAENTEAILKEEIGAVFERVLEDAGVYKRTPEGKAAFLRFINSVNE